MSAGIANLYQRAPIWAQTAAVSALGALHRWQRFGGEFQAILADALDATYATPDALARIQERLWDERIRAAVAEVAAYGGRRMSLADVASLPVLDKADVRRDPARFLRRGLPRREVVNVHTSGTTGAGLAFAATRFAVRRTWAFNWRYRRWHGIPFGEWSGVFGGRPVVPPGQDAPPFWRVNHGNRMVMFSEYHLTPERAPRYLEEIRRRGLRWLHGYPSVIGLLARFGLDAGLAGSTDVRWITLCSESVLEPQREAIARMFGVAPRQQYGLSEGVAMISECPMGRLHVDEDFARVEFLPVDDAPGAFHVVGTNLDNAAFPLLRYRTGDLARLPEAAGPCPCGRHGRIVSELDGRREDLVVLADGSWVGRVSNLFKAATHVAEAQVVQRRAGEAILRIVRLPAYGDADEAAIRALARERMGDRLAIAFEYVDKLPRTRTGKLRLVVSELQGARTAPPERASPAREAAR